MTDPTPFGPTRREAARRRRANLRGRGAVLLLAGLVLFASISADCAEPQSAVVATETTETNWKRMREEMVDTQIEARGVRDPRVLTAMRKVPRHRFVPDRQRSRAYGDYPLPIAASQTISQPFIVAAMTEALDPQPGDRMLEIGTGSGYQAAVLSEVVARVYSIEIVEELALAARALLAEQGYDNVDVIQGDGYRGLPAEAPFDGIIVTAAPAEVPRPLLDQLAPGARLVIPVGRFTQDLLIFQRTETGIVTQRLFPVRFVPMTGEAERRRER